MLRWSIATVCMGGALEGKLAAAAKAGFRAVELFENDLTFFSGKPRDARRMADDLGLEIVALQPLRDFEAMPDPIRARNFERAARKLELMDELGARLLCLCSNVSPEAIDDPSRAAADLAELADLARRRGMRLGYEALAWGRHVKDWTAAWDIVRTADRANLGIVLDSFHICVRGNPIEPIAALPADRIALVQVADAPALRDGPPVAQPPLSLLSRPGRLSDRRLSRRRHARRLSRSALARNLQRSVSRRLGRRRSPSTACVRCARQAKRFPKGAPRAAKRHSPICRRCRPRPWSSGWNSSSSPPATPTPMRSSR